MDDRRFDGWTRGLTHDTSRRGLLAGLLGLAGGALLGASEAAPKRGKGKGKGKGRGREKVGLCHRTKSEKNPFRFIRVGAPAAERHVERHGDTICPTDDPCNTFESCDDTGACVATPVPDDPPTACTDELGNEGVCVGGVCVV